MMQSLQPLPRCQKENKKEAFGELVKGQLVGGPPRLELM